jgi:Beta-propeller repeat/Abnormal spindle-like microcephaly-assoc'd, ASPM-SPD-2-Hydin
MKTQVYTTTAKRFGKRTFACISASFAVAFGVVVLPIHSAPGSSGTQRAKGGQVNATPTTASLDNRYGKIPLSFEPNVGQSDAQVQYIAHASGYSLFLTPRETVFLLKSEPAAKDHLKSVQRNLNRLERGSSLRLHFLNCNLNAPMTPANELVGKINYLIGRDPKSWHTNIPTFAKVVQHDLYPGVDVVYYGTQRQLEYDFVVSPGADTRAIALSFTGANKLHVDGTGSLIASVATGDVRMRKPLAYQQGVGGERQIVDANYVVRGAQGVGISVGEYDPKRALVIDPILEYSTYLGGSNIDSGNAIAVAQDKTAFIAGGTFSTDFPTSHPLQPNHGGPDDFSRDAFVAKLSADGSTLLYATYLGGKNEDVANGIAVDTFGNAYVIGTTLSPDFPVTPGSFNTECGGDGNCGSTLNPQHLLVSNAFVTKLNAAGSALIYSGFLGEYENVKGQAIAVDTNQIAYVTGQTDPNGIPTVPIVPPDVPPPPFPITAGAAQPIIGGATDAFLSKISATGSTILYSTYIGGGDEDFGFGVAIDANANAYVTGLSYSPNFPVTGSALQSANGGAGDAFFTKINTGGGAFVYSTLLGGGGLDQGNGIAVDPNGNVYVAGESSSVGLFASPRPYGGNADAFVAKFNPSLTGATSLLYFTYLGGSLADAAKGVAIDTGGNAYVTGSTVSADFPVVGAVFQPAYGGGNADAFVAELDPTGSTIVYSAFLGGSDTDSGYGIAVDSIGSAYVTGQTCSLDFPLTNPEQASSGGNCDAFISKVGVLNGITLNPNGLVFQSLNVGATSLPQTVTLTTGDSAVAINSVGIGGANPSDFAETTTCGATVASGSQCTLSVTFSPTAVGLRKGSLILVDTENGVPVTHVIVLTGSTSTVQLSASSLNFGTQSIGVTTTAQAVTVTNIGTSPLTISAIVTRGDYAETDNCTKAPVQPSSNCVVNVTYTPTSSGASLGALTITDDAPGSPQVILLNGIGLTPDFTVAAVPASVTVVAGQSTSFTLDISSISAFVQTISLSCSGAPTASACTISPISVALAANGTAKATVTVSTVARTMLPPTGMPRAPWLPLVPFYVLALVTLLALATRLMPARRRGLVTACLLMLTPVLLMSACNGGTAVNSGSGTPAGSYQIVVTGSAGTTAHSVPVNLQVK